MVRANGSKDTDLGRQGQVTGHRLDIAGTRPLFVFTTHGLMAHLIIFILKYCPVRSAIQYFG